MGKEKAISAHPAKSFLAEYLDISVCLTDCSLVPAGDNPTSFCGDVHQPLRALQWLVL